MTFHGKPRASSDVMHHVHESPWVMLGPLVVLALGARCSQACSLSATSSDTITKSSGRGALFTLPDNNILEEFHHVPVWVKLSPFVAMVIGFVIAWYFYIRSPETPKELAKRHRGLYLFLLNKWYFDELYDLLFVRSAKWLGRFLWKRGDGWLIDGFGPDGVSRPGCRTSPIGWCVSRPDISITMPLRC